jgi:hypothetical protein
MDMRRTLREAIQKSPLYPYVQSGVEWVRNEQALRSWALDGAVGPPPHLLKQGVLREYAARYGLRTLVETGTYLGSMVHAMRPHFDRVVTIEVDQALAARARWRFRNDPGVTVLQGDSAELIADVVRGLDGPALFWLDGHFSGGITGFGASHCPVMQELPPVLGDARFAHVVLIDDSRCFGSDPAYPTIDEVRAAVLAARPGYSARLENDIQRYAPGA